VEDPVTRELIAHMLHMAGFTALAAPTGERALVELREHRRAIDWLVASVSLPGLVDAAILRDEFQSLHPARTTLFLSASQHQSTGPEAPVSPAEVVAQLQALASPAEPTSPVAEHAPALAA
jgi:DNA-binding response OmpR family regulator